MASTTLTPSTLDLSRAGTAPAGLGIERGERAARRALRAQIARLEARLGELEADGIGRTPIATGEGAPRIATLAELERVRDALAGALADGRGRADRRGAARERSRRELERAIASPASHRWKRVRSESIGDHGCKHWHVRPRLGPIGILSGWWRVKISSGCP